MLIFCENTDIYDNFMCDIGLSKRCCDVDQKLRVFINVFKVRYCNNFFNRIELI
jgi:hypothetical protein